MEETTTNQSVASATAAAAATGAASVVHQEDGAKRTAKSKHEAFMSYIDRIMLSDDVEAIEAFLLSYMSYIPEGQSLPDLWITKYKTICAKVQRGADQTTIVETRMLNFLKLWASSYPEDFSSKHHSALLAIISKENAANVVNEFKLLFLKKNRSKLSLNTFKNLANFKMATKGLSTIGGSNSGASHNNPLLHLSKDGASNLKKSSTCPNLAVSISAATAAAAASSSSSSSPATSPLASPSSSPASPSSSLSVESKNGESKNTLRSVSSADALGGGESLLEDVASNKKVKKGSKKRFSRRMRKNLSSFSDLTIARELTWIESEIFNSISRREFLDQGWQKLNKTAVSPNITKLITRFNEVGFWVATEILTKEEKYKVKYIKRFIKIGQACLHLANFNTMMEILSGLSTSAVQRLKTTWQAIPARYMTMFNEMQSVMNPLQNFATYREALDKRRRSGDPTLPYMGLILRDLTFYSENPMYLSDGTINAALLLDYWHQIKKVRQYQSNHYSFQRDHAAYEYLKSLAFMDNEDVLYALSLSSQPSPRRGQDPFPLLTKERSNTLPAQPKDLPSLNLREYNSMDAEALSTETETTETGTETNTETNTETANMSDSDTEDEDLDSVASSGVTRRRSASASAITNPINMEAVNAKLSADGKKFLQKKQQQEEKKRKKKKKTKSSSSLESNNEAEEEEADCIVTKDVLDRHMKKFNELSDAVLRPKQTPQEKEKEENEETERKESEEEEEEEETTTTTTTTKEEEEEEEEDEEGGETTFDEDTEPLQEQEDH
ncbi:Ras guanine nucleotide exchange factor bud5 [Balamuthia mandrillaris]